MNKEKRLEILTRWGRIVDSVLLVGTDAVLESPSDLRADLVARLRAQAQVLADQPGERS